MIISKSRLSRSNSDCLSVGVAQIPTRKDEDYFCTSIDLVLGERLSSVGILDGHGGDFAAKLCKKELHKNIISKYVELLGLCERPDDFNSEAVFCEAMKLVYEDIDHFTKKESCSGTTAVSLFAKRESDGSTRVICPWVGDSRCILFLSSGETVVMTEDHTPYLEREKNRIVNQQEAHWSGLPVDVRTNCFSDQCQSSSDPTRTFTTNTSFTSIYNNEARNNEPNYTKNVNNKMVKVHPASFIDRRKNPKQPDSLGPLTVFSRYNVSLAVTRSIGDRYGPRSCVPQPDVSAVTVAPNEHARFVLASDGLWDVLKEKHIRPIIFDTRNPIEMADQLAKMAVQKRFQNHIQMDDITVIVVDIINPMGSTTSSTVGSTWGNCLIC